MKVDLQVIDWNSIDQQVSTMIQNNQPPDILNLNAFASYAKDGLLYTADEVALAQDARGLPRTPSCGAASTAASSTACRSSSSARAFFYNRTLLAQAGLAGAAADLGRVRAGRAARSRRSAAAPSATRCRSGRRRRRPSGRSGCGTTAATGRPARRGRSTASKNVQALQFLADARQQAQGDPGQPGQDQPHRRRLPAVQGRQGGHGHGLQPARRPARRRGQGGLRRGARCRPTPAPA